MAEALEWQFNLFDKISAPAASIAKNLDAATEAMAKAAPASDKLTAATDKTAAAQQKLAPAIALTIAQHNAVAKSFSAFAQAAAESSLTLDQHAKVAKALGEAFSTLGKSAAKTQKAILQDKIAFAESALVVPRLKKQLEALNKEMNPEKPKKYKTEFGNLMHSFAGFRQNEEGGLTFNFAEGIGAAVNAVERLAAAFGAATSKALETAAAGDKATRATTLNLGAVGGKELLTYFDQVIAKSRGLYTQAQLRGLAAPLEGHGIGLPDIKRFLPAALSVEARGGSAAGALGALGDVRTNRSVGAGTLDALGLGSFADKQKIASQLGRQFGFGFGYAKKNPEAVLGAVSERLQYQPQKTEQVVRTLLTALAGREAGGKLGGDAANAQNGTAATLTRFQNLPQTISERLTSSGQLDGLVFALDNFMDTITGPKGKGFIDGLAAIIDKFANLVVKVSGWLGEKSEAENIRESGGIAFEDKAGNLTDQISKREKYRLAETALRGQGFTGRRATGYDLPDEQVEQLALGQYRRNIKANKNAGAGTVLAGEGGSTDQFTPKWGDLGKEIGKSTAAGLVEGLLLSQAPEGAMATLMDKTFTAGDKKAEIHSPSARSRRSGRHIGTGLALGLGDSQGNIDAAMDRAFAIDDVAAGSRFNGGGGGGTPGGGRSITLQINEGAIKIDGAGKNAAEIADAVLARIAERSPGDLISQLEQAVDELGA